MNLGIVELNEIAALEKRKTILNVIARNDKDNVPAGFTAVYLRDEFVQVVPDEILPQIKELLIYGFEWDKANRAILGITTNLVDHYQLGPEIIWEFLEWAELQLRNDG